MEGREQALNDDRALAGQPKDVRQHLFERAVGAVDAVHVVLRADVQLGPHFIARREQLQRPGDFGPVQPGGVGDERELEEREAAAGAQVDDRLDGLGEVRAQRRLAVAAQGHLAQLQQRGRHPLIARPGSKFARLNQGQRPLQFPQHHWHIKPSGPRRAGAVHLAIGTVEVAPVVRIQVHAHGQSARTGRDDGIDKAVVQEVARTAERGAARRDGADHPTRLGLRNHWRVHTNASARHAFMQPRFHVRTRAPRTPGRVRVERLAPSRCRGRRASAPSVRGSR